MDVERALSQRAFVGTDLLPWGNTSIAWRVVWLNKSKKKKKKKVPENQKAWIIKETILPAMSDSEFKPLTTHVRISQCSIKNGLK